MFSCCQAFSRAARARGKYGIISKERYGCLNHHRRASRSNNRTIPIIEEHVLAGLTELLVSAEAVVEAVRACHEKMNRQNQARRAQAEVDRKTQRHLPVSLALLLR
jgi:site-specific DNA recombinase